MVGKSYSPEDLMLFRNVFDDVVKNLTLQTKQTDMPAEHAQIAKQLLACAATGERDPVELRLAALAGLSTPDPYTLSR